MKCKVHRPIVACAMLAAVALLTFFAILHFLSSSEREGARNRLARMNTAYTYLLSVSRIPPESKGVQSWKSGYFPDTVVRSTYGDPLYSWRAYAVFVNAGTPLRVGKRWDDPENRTVAKSGASFAFTGHGNMCAEVVANCKSDGPFKQPIAIIDVPNDTIVLVEICNCSWHWCVPRDIDPDVASELSQIGYNGRGFFICFADGVVWELRSDVDRQLLKQFMSTNGAKVMEREALLGEYVISRGGSVPVVGGAAQFR